MQSIIQHAAPNVVPGTNFNTQRFQELYSWITGLAADSTRISQTPHRYGLLQAYDGKPSLGLEKIGGVLVLDRCVGLTPGGRIIGLFEDHTPSLETHLDDYELDRKKPYYIMAGVEGNTRTPFGPKTGDSPERPQFSMPAHYLHIQAVDQEIGIGSDTFPVGILTFEEGDWQMQKSYIPPCVQIGGSSVLAEKYLAYKEAMKSMIRSLPEIIHQTDSFRDKSMLELREFCMQCGCFLATQQKNLQTLTLAGSPIEMVRIWMSFANLIQFMLSSLSDRHGFFNLLHENTRSVNGVMLTTERLNKALGGLIEKNYDQQDLLGMTTSIDELLTILVPMFKAMGKGTLRSNGNSYEGTAQIKTETEARKSHITW